MEEPQAQDWQSPPPPPPIEAKEPPKMSELGTIAGIFFEPSGNVRRPSTKAEIHYSDTYHCIHVFGILVRSCLQGRRRRHEAIPRRKTGNLVIHSESVGGR